MNKDETPLLSALLDIRDSLKGHQHVDTNRCAFCSIMRKADSAIDDFRSYTAIGGFINPNRDEERDAHDRRAERDEELERRVHSK